MLRFSLTAAIIGQIDDQQHGEKGMAAETDTTRLKRAALWDLDGVLVDSAEVHYRAWLQALDEDAHLFTLQRFHATFGTTNRAVLLDLFDNQISEQKIDYISTQKKEYFNQLIYDNAKLMAGVYDWLEYFQSQGVKQAVASSANSEYIEQIVVHVGIAHFFKVVLSAEKMRSKPQPDVFLAAATQLDALPENCIVFEDALAGIQAAKRAGMHCVAIASTHTPSALQSADIIITSFQELMKAQVQSLWDKGVMK